MQYTSAGLSSTTAMTSRGCGAAVSIRMTFSCWRCHTASPARRVGLTSLTARRQSLILSDCVSRSCQTSGAAAAWSGGQPCLCPDSRLHKDVFHLVRCNPLPDENLLGRGEGGEGG